MSDLERARAVQHGPAAKDCGGDGPLEDQPCTECLAVIALLSDVRASDRATISRQLELIAALEQFASDQDAVIRAEVGSRTWSALMDRRLQSKDKLDRLKATR